jgi:hypothetical protein
MDRYKDAETTKGIRKEGERMERGINIGVTALVIINAILLCTSVALYIVKENEIEKRILLDKQLEDTVMERRSLSAEVEKVRSVNKEMELDLAVKKYQIRNLQEKFDILMVQSKMAGGEDTSVTTELLAIQDDYYALQEDYDQLQQSKEILEHRLQDMMRSGVKLQTIVVEPEEREPERPQRFTRVAEPEPVETVTGEVLAVNKEYEFLVVNLGMNSGITKDSDISIYKGNELMGTATVEKLYDNISAVVVSDKKQLNQIKIGDTVIGTVDKYL